MLNEIALDILNQSETVVQGLFIGAAVVGAIVSGFVDRSTSTLSRSPFFALTALIVFLIAIAQISWLAGSVALWVLLLFHFVASVVAGFFMYRLALARSRDAYGHGYGAFLIFIPIAFFWLLLKASKDAFPANKIQTIPIFNGAMGIISGIVLFVGSHLIFLGIEKEAVSRQPGEMSLESLVNSYGVSEAGRIIADSTKTPMKIDEYTTLVRVEMNEETLNRFYVVSLDTFSPRQSFLDSISNTICSYEPFRTLMRAGLQFNETYMRDDETIIFSENVSVKDC